MLGFIANYSKRGLILGTRISQTRSAMLPLILAKTMVNIWEFVMILFSIL